MDPLSVIGYISLVLGSVLAIFSRIPKQTIQNQKELIETYEKRLKSLEDQREEDKKQHIENVKAIAELQGQIKVYKELPLNEMAAAMKEISEVNKTIASSNRRILKALEKNNLLPNTIEEHTETTKITKETSNVVPTI